MQGNVLYCTAVASCTPLSASRASPSRAPYVRFSAIQVEDLKYFEVVEFEGGERYEGAWVRETMNGRGTYYYSSGNVYEGQWKDGAKHGRGKHTWADGNIYEGEWEEDKMHGRGKYTFPAGSEYEGEYR